MSAAPDGPPSVLERRLAAVMLAASATIVPLIVGAAMTGRAALLLGAMGAGVILLLAALAGVIAATRTEARP